MGSAARRHAVVAEPGSAHDSPAQPLPHSTTGALASEKIHSWTYPPCSTGSAKMIIGLRAFERQSQMAAALRLDGVAWHAVRCDLLNVRTALPSQPANEPRKRICFGTDRISARNCGGAGSWRPGCLLALKYPSARLGKRRDRRVGNASLCSHGIEAFAHLFGASNFLHRILSDDGIRNR